ncbi:DUF1744-domain-containing protein [Clavulina sp. PMI_390]|nr:DUF1744-domain-containing protein [Clavulina sp. PMI_390]
MARGSGTRGSFRGNFRGRSGGFRGGRGRGRGGAGGATTTGGRTFTANDAKQDEASKAAERLERTALSDEVDEKLGFGRFTEGPKREGWLVNMHPTTVKDEDAPNGQAAVDYYFIQDDGGMFKATIPYDPYFHIGCKTGTESTVEEWLMKTYEGVLRKVSRVKKEDLKLANHLLGYQRTFLQLSFRNVTDLMSVRKEILPLAQSNGSKMEAVDAYAEVMQATARMDIDVELDPMDAEAESTLRKDRPSDPRELIMDIREYDVTYYLRVAIDNDIRVGYWYTVAASQGDIILTRIPERVKRADPVVMAFDIEVTKAPLKFPDQAIDQIMMISYMIDGQGFLITNRDIVSEDIEDFDYTPKPEYDGPFTIFNEPDEAAVIRRWFEHIRESKPTVMATYNGDAFDFPFVDARAKVHGIDMYLEIGFAKDQEDEYKCRSCVHMDCFRWVKRDSYLPQGSQGLKAVTTYKLGYNPLELDPELMTPYAVEQPQTLAQYSVSDAVATYYLYMKYVHPFVFSLCNIIPLNPDEVLRKGSGTLCETLLMVEAYTGRIIMPNRHEEPQGEMFEGHLLASETYVGGHVEALEAGVFRSDIPTNFKVVPEAAQKLIDDLDRALQFCITQEFKTDLANVTNYDEVKASITKALEDLRDNPSRTDNPLIYHLDVAAMYPNIMLSNRLQPDSVVTEATCAMCDYNRPGKTCDRRMTWAWRGEYFPAGRDEFNMVKFALTRETMPPKRPGGPRRQFDELSPAEQSSLLHKRLGDYSRKVYRKTKETKVVEREAIICQRENPFYIDTVRAFRDRRYTYKGLHKDWKKKLDAANAGGSLAEIEEAKKMIVLYDSLQLAHKCILNSFYGYVMRKGARWHSMEMAGITCLTGARIIQMARQLVEQIGRPLELDTDGIWCMLPGTFPENFTFKVASGKPLFFSYPCTMLNHLVYDGFTNHQYHDLVDPEKGTYAVHSENSIFFELDGPYKAMILPSSKEEDKLLKKRYAVFNDDGSLAELKGFEVKRRGELQLIKIFQTAIFEKFLLGTTLEECYGEVAVVADQWLDVLFSKGASLTDEELVDLISENRSMSKTLAEYGSQKSTSISTARRLAEFLGSQMVKDKGLACKFIISEKPLGAPVTERAVPVAIFSAEESVKRTFLRKWLRDNRVVDFDIRSILDWNYYIERLGSVIQKLITIPAAMQKVSNPVPRVRHPDWLHKRVTALEDKFQQHKMTDFFKRIDPSERKAITANEAPMDIEDFGKDPADDFPRPKIATVQRKPKAKENESLEIEGPDPDPRTMKYSEWIALMKPRWKQRQTGASGGSVDQPSAVPTLFRGVPTKVEKFWDIFQVRATNTPGRYMLWIFQESQIVSIPIRIPREFYLNLKIPASRTTFLPDYTAESTTRTLPRNRPNLNLYKISIPEDVYARNESHFLHLTHNPSVDGVFETQVSPDMRAVLRLGTVCTPTDGTNITLSRARDTGLQLGQLQHSSTINRKYLPTLRSAKHIFLFHATTSPRHVFGLFYPNGSVKIHIVDNARERQPLPRLQETYEKGLKQYRGFGVSGIFEYPDELDFETAYHTSDATAMRAISRELFLREDNFRVLTIASQRPLSYYEAGIPKLGTIPILMLPSSKKNHSLDAFPWQPDVAKKMLTRYLYLSSWLAQRHESAGYHDVPMGNVVGDEHLFYADVALARRLIKRDAVLWWSPGSLPDLGGREMDVHAQGDELTSLELSFPGCYSNVCLSIQVKNLAINSVMQAALVNEMEGSGGATAFDSTSHTIDDYSKGEAHSSATLGDSALSPAVFTEIKAVVRGWQSDSKIRPARDSLAHFGRWVASKSAHMYDTSIHKFVHELMKKTFIQMLAEFKRLGSSVVYADFGNIILLTSKPPGTAAAYATYLLNAVTTNDLFKFMGLKTITFYDYLLFMDRANLGGVICDDPMAIEPSPIINISSGWNIKAFLPPFVQAYFDEAVRNFILDRYRLHRKHSTSSRQPMRVINGTQGDGAAPVDIEKAQESDATKTYITSKLTRRLLSNVDDIMEEYKAALHEPEMPAEFRFPVLPGSHLHMTNPSLEYVKFLCAVLACAQEFKVEVGLLRRNLLDLVGVKEFSDEAQFRNPCDPFKLDMVICRSCNNMRSMDFCRDEDLLPSVEDSTAASSSSAARRVARWHCLICSAEYDRGAIEASIIDAVRRLLTQYQVQDLKCAKCGQVRSDAMSAHCHCSGTYQVTLGKAEVRRKVKTITNVAIYHNLTLARVSNDCYLIGL